MELLKKSIENSPPPLDTLGELTRDPERDLLKKAKRKAITVFLAAKLIELKTSNIQAYRNMYYCNATLSQDGQELKTSYCKNRMCAVCNAIKTANLINGYLPELQKMESPYFVTLTVKAVKARFLKATINDMLKNLRTINQHLTKYRKFKLIGIRKLECNYNLEKDTYNPHFHIIIDGLHEATVLRYLWIAINCFVTNEGRIIQNADDQAQDIRMADMDSMTELFKYATKIVSKNGRMYPKQLDVIYSALRNKRVVQPFGIKKMVDEDEREKVIYAELTPDQALWQWDNDNYDWYNQDTGECLTGFAPDRDIKLLYEQLRE